MTFKTWDFGVFKEDFDFEGDLEGYFKGSSRGGIGGKLGGGLQRGLRRELQTGHGLLSSSGQVWSRFGSVYSSNSILLSLTLLFIRFDNYHFTFL